MRKVTDFDGQALGSVLKIHRMSRNLKQKQIAEYLGIDRSTYAKYETVRKPELDVIMKLAVLYEISLDEFLADFFIQTESEISPITRAASPYDEISKNEERLLQLYRNSIRKAEIMKAADTICREDNDIISEISDN